MGNTAAPPDSISREAFCWRFGDAGPEVRLRWPVMTGIESEVVEGFKALPKRGVEVGGALLGHQEANGDFVIESWRQIPIEHRSGPSYVLSDADVAAWREFALSRTAGPERFIGIYRSQTRPGLAVTPDDCAIVEKFLPREQGVLLIVKPLSATESVGSFYLCDKGAIVDASADSREFPFGHKAVPRGVVLKPATEPSAPKLAPAPPGESARAIEPSARNEAARATHRRSWRSLILPASAIITGSALGLYVHARGGIAPENPVPVSFAAETALPDLNLRTERIPDGIRLLWNPESAALNGATEGVVLVTHSGSQSEAKLLPDSLRRGSLQWHLVPGETKFEMRITAAGRTYAESVRVIEPARPVPGGLSPSDHPLRRGRSSGGG